MALHPPASPAVNTPTLCPQPAGDPLGTLGLPLTPHTLPRPYPDLHWLPSGCSTNHPVPAGHEEPPNPPCSFGRGGSHLCGVPPTTSGLQAGSGPGGGKRVTGAAGAWGQRHRSQPKPLLLFVSRLGAGGGRVSPTRSPVLAAGNGDCGGSPPLQVGLVVGFFFIV